MARSTVLVVSCDVEHCEPLLAMLRARQSGPILITDVDQAIAAAENSPVSLIVLNGRQDFCQLFFRSFSELRAKQTAPPLLIVARESSEAFAISSLRAGASEYLSEPFDLATFSESIARWVPECTLTPPLESDLQGGEVLVGASPAMQALRANIRRVAATDCNVLITGETGSGKELVAQLIHHNSARKVHPLISINCAAIPDSLLESELFGYERGAFTGAGSANQGKLMTANRGTVFFDEIGDMSRYAQAKILRAIETKEVQRLGSARNYSTDIRILAATHHNLDELASTETFRRDLYFRLNVGRIHLPPLRERKTDIAGLVDRMVLDLNRKLGRKIEGVTKEAIRSLAQYDWPGNVRELKNVIEKIFIGRDAGQIGAEDLSSVLPLRRPPQSETASDSEVRGLREALATCNGNKSKAAEKLNWSRMTLYRKLAKYKLAGNLAKGLPAVSEGLDKGDAPKKSA
jgi:DNA-binding NtrC family response regulator